MKDFISEANDGSIRHLCIFDKNVYLLELKVSLDMVYSEDEIYELSLSREPKTSAAVSSFNILPL